MADPQIVDPFAQANAAANQPQVVDPFSPTYEKPKPALMRGVNAAARGGVAAAEGTGALIANALGATELGKTALAASKEQSEAAGADTMRVEDIHDFGSATDFLQYAVGYLGTQLGANAVGAGVGRLAGGLGAKMVGAAGAEMAAKHAGTVAGLAGTSIMQEVGQIYPDAIEQGVADPIKRSLVGGAIAAGADLVPELYAARRVGLLGKAAKGGPGPLKTAAGLSAAEAATELFQTYVERASAGQPTTGAEANSDYLNSAVLGGIGGGLVGGVTGAYSRAKTMVDGAPPVQDSAPPVQPAPVNTPDVQAPEPVQGPPGFAGTPASAASLEIPADAMRAEAPRALANDVVPVHVEPFAKSHEPGPTILGEPVATALPRDLILPPKEGFEKTATDLITERNQPTPQIIDPFAAKPNPDAKIVLQSKAATGGLPVFHAGPEGLTQLEGRFRNVPAVTPDGSIKYDDAGRGGANAPIYVTTDRSHAEWIRDNLPKSGKNTTPRVVYNTDVRLGNTKIIHPSNPENIPVAYLDEKTVAALQAQGYDSLAVSETGRVEDAKQIVVFDPKQVGSLAVAKPPTFEQQIASSAQDYNHAAGIAPATSLPLVQPDPQAMAHIASAYAQAPNTSPDAAPAYHALNAEVAQQFDTLSRTVKMEPWKGEGRPYTDAAALQKDVTNNKHLWVDEAGPAHPMMTPAENYMFRAVHDIYGHAMTGFDQTPGGQLNATRAHARMFSNVAVPALVTETLGRTAASKAAGVVVAPKAALLPEGTWRPMLNDVMASRAAVQAHVDAVYLERGTRALAQVETILGTPDHLRVETYLGDRGAGAITLSKLKDVISLNLKAKDILSVANHEGFHYLEHRVLPAGDLSAVKHAFRPGTAIYNTLIERVRAYDRAHSTNLENEVRAVPAEARAYAFEFWARGELAAQGIVQRAFTALKRAIERIQNWVAGSGFKSYEDVFRAAEQGYYAKRYGSPFEVKNLDVPAELQLQSQASLADLATRAKLGEIPRVQINARIAELLDNEHAVGDIRHRFLERTREEAKGAAGSVKRAYLSHISSGENLARHSQGYKNVFSTLTAYAQRKNQLIADAVEKKLSKWVKGASEVDKVAVSKALLERTVNRYEQGTAGYNVLYARLNPAQRAMFDQATSMIADRLAAEFAADKASYARALGAESPQYASWLENRSAQVEELQKHGYFPERRYGDHVVHAYVPGPAGEKLTLYFSQHQREADARVEERELRRAMDQQPEIQIEYGYRYRAEHDGSVSFQQFLDMAARHGVAITQAERERLAKALVSADSIRRNRIFKRKDIAGYSEDGMRVLAEFGVSMANKIAYHEVGSAINDSLAGRAVDVKFDRDGNVAVNTNATSDLWAADGPMGGYFRNLADNTADFVLSPREGNKVSRGLRSLASIQFLGGSIAAGMVQLTSMAMNTTPWLTQYTGYTDAFTRSLSGYKTAMANHKALTDLPTLLNDRVAIPGVDEVEGLRHALQIAAQDGTTLDTEIYQLMGLSRGQEYSFSGRVQTAVKAWMAPFRITEQWNRQGSFIAAFKLAKDQNQTNEDAYKFAQNTVYSTQFRYDEANRPALARSDVGALLFVFKTYPIFMLETMTHLAKVSPHSAVVMLLTMGLMAGIEGMPFAEDLEDLVDTVSQRLFNSPFNTKRALRNVLKTASEAIVGTDLSSVLMHGIANELTGLSFASRVGMGNLIPGTRIGAADADYKRTLGEVLGPVGTIVQGYLGGADAVNRGQFAEAVKTALPLAAQNLTKGAEQWTKGYASDVTGKKLGDVSGWEAFWQSAGFSSSAIARAYDADRIDRQDVAFYKNTHEQFMREMVQAIRKGDSKGAADVAAAVTGWNRAHPEMPMTMSPDAVRRNVQLAGLPVNERTMLKMPHQLRGTSEYALGLQDR